MVLVRLRKKNFSIPYGMKVIQIPTNRKKQRIDYPDKIYATLPEKVFASLEYVKHYHEKGNPILISLVRWKCQSFILLYFCVRGLLITY